MNKEELIKMMEEELEMELESARVSDMLRRKTWNPIKKIQCMKSRNMFMHHVVGMELLIHKVKKFLKDES